MKYRLVLILVLMMSYLRAFAAGDHYDNSGKLYTVVLCVAVILVGIVLFLFYLDRRVSKMERSIEDQQNMG